MPREKYKQKLMKHRVCAVSRVIACASFLVLTIIGLSSIVRAMTLEKVENSDGIPSSWQISSLGRPNTIAVPISYWDQRQDDCNDPNRQFEWVECGLYGKGIIQNVVKSQLGTDGHPVPMYTNSKDAWEANRDVFTANITGHDPTQPTDNFYRWFHEVYDSEGKQLSKQYDRTITFTRTQGNTYEYGSKGTFPLDDVDFSDDDDTTTDHNYHFTAHMQIPMKIAADGTEKFWFSGDDDVWVFLNGQLVLDLGGLHEDIEGEFIIDKNGNVRSTIQEVNDIACRKENLSDPRKMGYSDYNNAISKCSRKAKSYTVKTNFKAGDVVNLDFFYAERSTTESNTRITIANMHWPISADSDVTGEIKGKVGDTQQNLIEYTSSIKNRDPRYPLNLERLAVYIQDESTATDSEGNEKIFSNSGFIPLSETTLLYTKTPSDPTSWKPLEISAPSDSLDGFKLKNPITMAPAGQDGDTLYFRYSAETSEYSGNITNRTSYYTVMSGQSGVTYDHVVIPYTGKTTVEGTENNDQNDDQEYDLKIKYVIDYEGEDPDPYIETPEEINKKLPNGAEYEYDSPKIEGFEPDYETVKGKIEGQGVERVVVYRRKRQEETTRYKVTIHFIKSDGSKVYDDYVEMVEPGESFTHTPESLEGYTHDPEIISIQKVEKNEERTVVYTPIVENHTVTIHYVYENGAKALDDFFETYKEGEKFSITSPTIDGYRRDIAVVSGKMGNKDRVFTVTYTMKDTPITPVGPAIPDKPEDPKPIDPETPEPIDPEIPEDNDNLIPAIPVTPNDDDELTYMAPLGEVAYVPNTGIISDIVAPIFDQFFADTILSQGFVLVMLLIFAGSFSTYFSLRKYLNLAVAPATNTRSVKKMPKSIANSKAARNMKRAAQKTKKK